MSGSVFEAGNYHNGTATAAISSKAGAMLGFYVNSTSSGVVAFRDGGASGTVMSGSITPAIGFHRFPAGYGNGLHMTVVSGTINITVFYVPAATS